MRIRNTADSYGLVSRALHWLTALLILGLIALGWYMVDLSYFDRWYNESLELHKVLGLLVLVLGIVTAGWRVLSPSPASVASLTRWERLAATFMHYALFTMVFVVPVTGYLISTSAGKAIDVYGWFAVPALVEVDPALRDLAIELHFWLAYATAALAAVHAGAALKHQFVDRDGTLARMLWR